MATIATVKEISGKVLAQAQDGSIRELKVGDAIADTDKIITGQGSIVLADASGETLALEPGQTVAIDNSVFNTELLPTAKEAAVANSADINSVIQSLDGSGDLLENLDATAAGLGAGGGEGSGSSFVQLLRIAEGVNPLSFNYNFTPPGRPEVLVGDALPTEQEPSTVTEPPAEPPAEPVVAITYEYYTEVTTSTVPGDTTYGSWTEVGRNTTTDTSTTADEDNKQNVVTTTTTTTVDLSRDVTTSEITTTTTTTYKVEVTTTTNPDGTVTVSRADPVVDNVETSTETTTTTTQQTNQEVSTDTNVDYDPWPAEPVVTVTYEYYTETTTERTPLETVYGEWAETGRNTTTETTTTADEENERDIITTTTTTTVDYSRDVTTGELVVTTTTTYQVTVTTTTYPDGTSSVVRSDPVVDGVDSSEQPNTNTTVETDQEVLTDTDIDYTPWPVEETGENWFMSQGGNNSDQAYTLEEEEPISFNVQFQDRSGEQLGKIADGESVTLNIKVTGDQEALALLDILDVKAAKGFSATWELNDDELEILLTNTSGKDQNLQGNPVDVEFKVGDDGLVGTNTSIGFDIDTATLGGVWETNDQVNYLINDIIKKGGAPD